MKRYLISLGLIITSAVYVFIGRHGSDDETVRIIAPKTATTDALPTTLNTPSESTAAITVKDVPITAPKPTDTTPVPIAVTPTPKLAPTPAPTPTPVKKGLYTDGTYKGNTADAYYGYVQVAAIVSEGKLTDIQILEYPNDRSTSRSINSQALPYLVQEAVSAQSAQVDTISGASDTSAAFRESLASALARARS